MSPPVVEILGELWELPNPALADRWARCLRPDAAGRQLDVTTPYHWTSSATVQSIKARAGEWMMFHAAGVSDDHGNVVALVGPSGTGKSTAARTICREAFGYVTDETVAVRPDGSVVPFPKPISAIPEAGGVKVEFGPDELGLRDCPAELTLGGVSLLKRRSDVAEPVVERLGLLKGMIALVPDMSALPHVPSALARLAGLVEASGGVHKITYRDADQLHDAVRQVLAAAPVRSGFRHIPATRVPEETLRGFSHPITEEARRVLSKRIIRTEHHDAIELEGEVLLLRGSTCTLLQGIGSLVWLAADRSRSFDEIVAAVVEIAGDHSDANRLVQEAVAELVSREILVSRES